MEIMYGCENRGNVLNCLAGQRQRIAALSKTGALIYLDLADYERLRGTEFALAYVAFRFLSVPLRVQASFDHDDKINSND